ncbi:hypothetical protein K492DRAFT_203473 [Lichtheimia hyalospora FSU 10163]|nr:hypothetical protein K492DRAFT_203473 [Lichtheimia hyalospora FSU 10163]
MKSDPTESDCWLVIGAHQAGATEGRCAEIAGLTRSAAHKIISNFKKLGSPQASTVNSASVFLTSHKRRRNDYEYQDSPSPGPRKRGRPRKMIYATEGLIRDTIGGNHNKKAHDNEPSNNEWTEHDDRLLLSHVLGVPQNFKWKELETIFEQKHLSKICRDRWTLLRKEMLKDINKNR